MNILEQANLSLEDLLPHRGAMLLIDEVLEVDGSAAVTRSISRPEWPLAGECGVQSLILIELAAQAAGVCNGWDRIQTQGMASDKMGYLVGIKRARFSVAWIPFGEPLVARAENTYNFENLREVSCSLHWLEDLVGEVVLQLFQI